MPLRGTSSSRIRREKTLTGLWHPLGYRVPQDDQQGEEDIALKRAALLEKRLRREREAQQKKLELEAELEQKKELAR